MRLYECMHDVFAASDTEWLSDRFRVAAKTRWQRLAAACDDGGLEQQGSPLSAMHQAPLMQHLQGPRSGGGSGSTAGKAQALYGRMAAISSAIMNVSGRTVLPTHLQRARSSSHRRQRCSALHGSLPSHNTLLCGTIRTFLASCRCSVRTHGHPFSPTLPTTRRTWTMTSACKTSPACCPARSTCRV